MRKLLKRSLAIMLICSIVMSTNIFAEQSTDISVQVEESAENKIDFEISELEIQGDEEVRIIVELNEEPIIETATELGVKVEEMEESIVQALEEDIADEQTTVIEKIEEDTPSLEVHENFTNVFNGFSATVQYDEIEDIASNASVKQVYLANRYERIEPQMTNSDILTGSMEVNMSGYTGAGIVVSILDTGIDPTHKDFVIDDDVIPKLNETLVTKNITGYNLKGKYYTEKVPYGYNYADKNNEILDTIVGGGANHGMHVAGIVAANGEIKGVAPNAQILAMKVFSNNPNNPYTYSDIIIAAIDDSIKLGADVMNLSLGSTAAFVDEEDPEQIAIKNAVDNGIVMSIAAGNSGHYGYGFGDVFEGGNKYPYASNPDIGIVASPGLVADAIQVASVNNLDYIYQHTLTVNGVTLAAGYGYDQWSGAVSGADYQVVALSGTKLGYETDYENVDVSGKVVLIKRGTITFEEKVRTAFSKNAIGVILYNNENSFVYNLGGWDIPVMKISNKEGAALEDLLSQNGNLLNVTIGGEIKCRNITTGLIAPYSNWGTTSTMDIKPEVSAPGSNIYSTLNNNGYGYKSGTSMATPQVAGGAALLLQKMNDINFFEQNNIARKDKSQLIKNILMNTAHPVRDANDLSVYASPRVQGAGLIDLVGATSTLVVATDASTGVAKVNAGEFSDNDLSFNIKLKNYSSSSRGYILDDILQTNKSDGKYNYLTSEVIGGDFKYFIDGVQILDGNISVPANSEVILRVDIVNIDIARVKANFVNGNFVEGFIFINSDCLGEEGTNASLSIPFVGFCGDWEAAPAFDKPIYDVNSFYYETALLYDELGDYYYLGYEGDGVIKQQYVGFSPNNDNYRDTITPIFSVLRNLKEISFNIIDSQGVVVTPIGEVDEMIKNYFDYHSVPWYYFFPNADWDGKVNGQVVPDGDYSYQITGVLADGVTVKTLNLPFKVDTVKPTITGYTIDEVNNTLTVNGNDSGGVGIDRYTLLEVVGNDGVPLATSKTGVFDLNLLKNRDYQLELFTVDYAGNFLYYNDNIDVVSGNVQHEVNSIYFENSNPISVETNSTVNLAVKVKYVGNQIVDITNDAMLTLTASNDNVVIEADKKVKGMKVGTSTITATYGLKTAEITVNVTATPVAPQPAIIDNGNVYIPPAPITPIETTNISDDEVALGDGSNLINNQAYIKGYADNTFRPDASITRAEISEILNRVLVLEGDLKAKNFTDLTNKHWAYNSIVNMQECGLLNGYKDNTFMPSGEITKAEFATIIARAIDYLELDVEVVTSPYKDISGHWAKDSINKMYAAGIFLENDGSTFNPDDKLTRAETVVLINQFIGMDINEDLYVTPSFTDVPKIYWAYNDIEAAYIRE